MNPAKFAELQVQMRQNQEGLGDYLKDLDDWTKDIKKKEEDMLMQSANVPNVPPVRNAAQRREAKAKEKEKKAAQNNSASKTKRISSYDYRSWDRFDVDAALQSSSEEEEEENVPKPPEPESVDEALFLKEKGNELFGQKKYQEAIDCYSKALEIEPGNATFLSNRAICYLKLEKFEDAENDCSQALVSDPCNTKALFRRATARVGLAKLDEAKADFLAVLEIEPGNRLARQEVDKLTESTRISKAVELIVEREAASKIPDWFPIPPEFAPDFAVMDVKTWKGKEPGGKVCQVPIREAANLAHLWRSQSPSPRPSPGKASQAPQFIYAPPPESWLPPPEAPNTPFQFQTDLRAMRGDRDRLYSYLKKVDPVKLPDLFGLSLDSSMLSEIVESFSGRDVDEGTAAFFQHLQRVNRYSTVALFLDSSLKPTLEKLTISAQNKS